MAHLYKYTSNGLTMFDKKSVQIPWGAHTLHLETGEVARQADGAVLADLNGTTVLATVVAQKTANPAQDFFPLSVDYIEKTYAAGRIPGGYFKREGKTAEHETLISRLIDRPLRPLFPENFYNDVHVVIHVLSMNPDMPTDIVAMVAASAALSLSGIPFHGPMGGTRVAYINGQYVSNPSFAQLQKSDLDLIVAGTEQAVLMVEAKANHLSEEVMLGAIEFGHKEIKTVAEKIKTWTQEAGKPYWNWQAPARDDALIQKVQAIAAPKIESAYQETQKGVRSQALKTMQQAVLAQFSEDTHKQVQNILFELESKWVRGRILSGHPRIDGRDTRTVRPIQIRNGLLARTHGSSLFTRGETQALAVTTLGTKSDEQIIDVLQGEYRERFMLHYNMPPFATGETGRMMGPKRREIGHGNLARRALESVLPSPEEFPYTIRVVSEITESNGSSSMASVCGGCLSLLDAGVPLKQHVAGVAMGLILEGNHFAVLTDILGDEDHLGDMDFKVAGTATGITALQMDIKIQGITIDIMNVALSQAKEGRMHILGIMHEALAGFKTELSEHAPRMIKIQVPADKIRDIIGKGGSNIQALTRETGCKIDIQENGEVTISSSDASKLEEAKRRIQNIGVDIEVGKTYEGIVQQVLDFGAVVEIIPGTGKTGLLHISEISRERIRSIRSYLSEGLSICVKVLQKEEEKNRIRLSMKDIEQPAALREYIRQANASEPALAQAQQQQ